MQSEINFVEFCHNKLHVSIQPQDISICHRFPKSENAKIRPMIVHFASRKAYSSMLMATKILNSPELRELRIFVKEHPTKQANILFSKARTVVKEKKLLSAWTKNGRILVKTLECRGSKIVVTGSVCKYC